METGRARRHHAPSECQQNFAATVTVPRGAAEAPGYIFGDTDHQLTALERKRSLEQKERRRHQRAKIRRCIAWLFIVLAILLVIAGIAITLLYFYTCLLGNCPVGCYDCEFEGDTWSKMGPNDKYSASSRYCEKLDVQFTDNSFIVGSAVDVINLDKKAVPTTAPLVHYYEVIDFIGRTVKAIELYWYMEQTVRNNETLKLVFSDNGDYFAGLGDFGTDVFKSKPAITKTMSYTLYSNEDDPMYLPFYLTRNDKAAICMFIDVQGSPIEVTMSGAVTEWVIYRKDDIQFHIYSGPTAYQALKGCNEKWNEVYPRSEGKWTDHFVIGSLSTTEIKTARETADILGTHYLLSRDSTEIQDSKLVIKDKDVIGDYDKVYFTWPSRLNLQDSGLTLTQANGIYTTDAENMYFIDYSTEYVKAAVATVLEGQTFAGVYLDDTPVQADRTCVNYRQCLAQNPIFVAWNSPLCPGEEFGVQTPLFQRHNYYESERSGALGSDNLPVVIERVGSMFTSHFHRETELTPAGLQTCFNNLLNLHLAGTRSVTCNMCGGLIPDPTDQTVSDVCDRMSQLAFFMPYVIMANEDIPPLITVSEDAGRYMTNNLNVRKRFRYYLEAVYRDAMTNTEPFIYPVASVYNEALYLEQQNGVMIGSDLFYSVVLEEAATGEATAIALPPGTWFTNGGPLLGEFYEGGQTITQDSSDMARLIFFRTSSIFVMDDIDNVDHVILRVFLPHTDHEEAVISHNFDYYDTTQAQHTVTITFSAPESRLSLEYGAGADIALQVSVVQVYSWFKDHDAPPAWATFNSRGDSKWNVVLDFLENDFVAKGEPRKLFDTWSQSIEVFS